VGHGKKCSGTSTLSYIFLFAIVLLKRLGFQRSEINSIYNFHTYIQSTLNVMVESMGEGLAGEGPIIQSYMDIDAEEVLFS
jgi:hypothetical protein